MTVSYTHLSDYGEKKNYEFAITEYESGEQLGEEQSLSLIHIYCGEKEKVEKVLQLPVRG